MRTPLGIVIRIAAAAVRVTVGRIMVRQKAVAEVSLPVAGHKLNDELEALGIRTPIVAKHTRRGLRLLLLVANPARRRGAARYTNEQVITMKRLSRHCL